MKETLPRRGVLKLALLTTGAIAAEQVLQATDKVEAATKAVTNFRGRRDPFSMSEIQGTPVPKKKKTPVVTPTVSGQDQQPIDQTNQPSALTGVGCVAGGLAFVGAGVAVYLSATRQARNSYEAARKAKKSPSKK